MIETRRDSESLGSFHTEIIRICRELGIIAGHRDSMTRPMGNLDRIGKPDGCQEGLQLMKSIGTLSENTERKVDLGRSRE